MKKPPFKWIDLTHELKPGIPTWGGVCGFNHELDHDYDLKETYRTHKIQMNAGVGTHMDAPAHFIPGGMAISDIDLNDLISPCVVIDISAKVHERYSLSQQDIMEFEKQYGSIVPGSFVIIYTGWDRYWNDPKKYRNALIFPSVSREAASLFLEREISGLGIDTLSPDRPDDGFLVHQMILGAGKYIVENIARANCLPVTGAYSLVLPIKIGEGSEAPVRLIGLVLEI